MKIAVLSDTQYGSHLDYVPFLELNRRFFREIFWPELQKRGIKVVVHLGDLLERRTYVNYRTATYLKEDVFDVLVSGGYHFHWIFGNHDIFYREATGINAARILAPNSIHTYNRATNVRFGECNILFVPWIVEENRDYSMQTIRQSPATVVFGHLELQGFQLDKYQTCQSGIDASIFHRFELVLTGHFHHRSIRDRIYYVGSHAEFTWSDYGDKHGFHIFDTDTRDVEFIENPFTVFKELVYDGTSTPLSQEELQGKIVRVVVKSKHDPENYSNFMRTVEEAKPLEVDALDTYLVANLSSSEVVSEAKSTSNIILEYVDASSPPVNKEKLKAVISDLYAQAQANT
jgi:DNA repair exonuclease SbcCD nuclease subunit